MSSVLKLTLQSAIVLTSTLYSTVSMAHQFSQGDLRIGHPWSRVMPSAAPVAGAYLTLTNSGAAPDTLTGGSTPIADRIEVHQMTMGDGIGRMRPLPKGVEIAAGAKVELAPGGIQLMLINPSQQLIEGNSFKATLQFARAGSVEVEFLVQRNASAETGNGTEHEGHGP
ncbi:copper chaperone PCu(A)C [Nitratireductor rhodophyticola]|uniref:copper chaperone PCu(A)C n=1 Tax=Nitratireductor rhodophyticola TaxID=2854036 RepID=UPI0026BD9D9D